MARRKLENENQMENKASAKRTSRKKKDETAAAAVENIAEASAPAEEAPVKKKRGRKPKNPDAAVTAPAPKKRGRKKAVPEMTSEAAPPVAAETAFVDSAPVDLAPDVIVDLAEPAEEAPVPAKKMRKPRAKKADAQTAPSEPKKRGRKPKETGPALTTILQIGDKEFDITDIALKAYKDYKRVHKRKAVTEFRIYVKPAENAAYYTVNGEGSEEFRVDLS